MTKMYDVEQLKEWGIVDYVVGASPGQVFVFATRDDPKQRHYLNLYKLVEGPSTASTPSVSLRGTSVGRQSCHISRRGNGSMGEP